MPFIPSRQSLRVKSSFVPVPHCHGLLLQRDCVTLSEIHVAFVGLAVEAFTGCSDRLFAQSQSQFRESEQKFAPGGGETRGLKTQEIEHSLQEKKGKELFVV